MGLLVHDAHDEEEPAGRQTVIHHLQDAALKPELGECEHAEHDEAQMADGAIGDELLPVRLDERDERAIDDADD